MEAEQAHLGQALPSRMGNQCRRDRIPPGMAGPVTRYRYRGTRIPTPLGQHSIGMIMWRAGNAQEWHVRPCTYMRTFAGRVSAAFVLEVFSRRIVGVWVATSLHTGLALEAMETGIWSRHEGWRRPVRTDPPLRPRSPGPGHPLHVLFKDQIFRRPKKRGWTSAGGGGTSPHFGFAVGQQA